MGSMTRPEEAGETSHSFLYASMTLVPPQEVLIDIVHASEEANARDGLSGMLICTRLRYVQLVEGPRPALERLRLRLGCDLRHRILWSHWGAAAPRRIPARLPMGYAGNVQLRAAGLALPPWIDRMTAEGAADLTATLAAVAHDLYPLSCRPRGRDPVSPARPADAPAPPGPRGSPARPARAS